MTVLKMKGVPARYLTDPKLGEYTQNMTAASYAVERKVTRAKQQFMAGRQVYTPDNQPRDARGKFRKILARLRFDLGEKQLQQIVTEIRKAEMADEVGDYAKSAAAGQNVLGMVDKIDSGTLDPTDIKNVRNGAAELGRVLAYLPLPQGQNTEKVRYSDLPPSTKKLIDGMLSRVSDKLDSEEARKANQVLESFKSGVRTMSSDQLLAQLNKLLRLLT